MTTAEPVVHDDVSPERRPLALMPTVVAEAAPWVGLRRIFTRFWPDTRPFRARMMMSLLLGAIGPVVGAAGIWLFKILVDDVLIPRDFALFGRLAAAYIGITALEGAVSFLDEYISTWVGEYFVLGLRTRLFDHVQRLSVGFFERRQLGDILSRLTDDVNAIEDVVLGSVAQTVTYSFQILLFAGALFYLNWQLALAALTAAPAFLLLARSFSRRIRSVSREKRRRTGSVSAVAEESLSNISLVQAYDRQADESARFRRENVAGVESQLAATRVEALFAPLVDLFEVVGVLAVVGIAIWELTQDRISLGGLLVFITYLTQLYGPVRGFGQLSNAVFAASAGAERIIELLDAQPAVTDPVRPRRLGRATGALALDRVGFRYPGTNRSALADLDFAVHPGQKVAVVGASGAGKSTIVKLLLRFYDPETGRITIDGVDLRDLAVADLRRNIAAVLQETLVFDGTVRDNIRWGDPGATEHAIRRAAEAADADDFVRTLPQGYDTRIGHRGQLLSGGQRQRIAIARAMVRDSPVLLLDEPTTGLDAASADRVLTPLRRLMAGRTTIIISHNLLTVTDADQILYLEHGHVTGAGTHAELLTTHRGYAHLFELHHQHLPPEVPPLRPPLPPCASHPARSGDGLEATGAEARERTHCPGRSS